MLSQQENSIIRRAVANSSLNEMGCARLYIALKLRGIGNESKLMDWIRAVTESGQTVNYAINLIEQGFDA